MDEVRERVLSQINNDELIELASGLARFQSFSGLEKDCAEWLGGYLERQGFEVELSEAEPNRPNVVARLRGDGSGASLMFNGHLDVDPLSEDYKHDPWRIEVRDGRLWGHGLANMKAGVVFETLGLWGLVFGPETVRWDQRHGDRRVATVFTQVDRRRRDRRGPPWRRWVTAGCVVAVTKPTGRWP